MDKYNRLTTAAKEALENSTKEIQDMIFEKASQYSNMQDTGVEISLHDILRAKQDILMRKDSIKLQENRKRRLAILSILVGYIYAIFGIVFYIYQNYAEDFKQDVGLIIAAMGATISIIGLFYAQITGAKLRKKTYITQTPLTNYQFLEMEIVNKWRTIEKLGRSLMLKDGVSMDKARSINSIIDFIATRLSTTIDKPKLKGLITTRNAIVHNEDGVSISTIIENIAIANKVIDELEKLIKS